MKIKITKGPGYENLEKFTSDTGSTKVAKSGWFPGNKYPANRGGEFVAQIAAQNEYGTSRIPARPFMRPAISNNQSKWKGYSEKLSKKLINGEISFEIFLEQMALVVEGDIRKEIVSVTSPPLAPATIQARLSRLKRGGVTKTLEKPLIDTAIMLNSLTRIVE